MHAYCYHRNVGGRPQPQFYTTERTYSAVWRGHGFYTFEGSVDRLKRDIEEGRRYDLPWRRA